MRTFESLKAQVREELRADVGVGSAGYSNETIDKHLNYAIKDLAEVFPIRDIVNFKTEPGNNTYTLTTGNEGSIELGVTDYQAVTTMAPWGALNNVAFVITDDDVMKDFPAQGYRDFDSVTIEGKERVVFSEDVDDASQIGNFCYVTFEEGHTLEGNRIIFIIDPLEDETDVGVQTVVFNLNYVNETIDDIIRITYDGNLLQGVVIDHYLNLDTTTEGPVRNWLLWGKNLILIGEVEDLKEVNLWVTREPKNLINDGDIPETPYYSDEALIQYTVAACYRESRDYERAEFHFSGYNMKKNSLLKRAVPQGQKDVRAQASSDYFSPISQTYGVPRTDRNPGGRYK